MNWFYFSALSVSCLAFAEITQQYILQSRKYFNERTSAVLTFFMQALFTSPIILIIPTLRNNLLNILDPSTLPYLLLMSFLSSLAMILYLRSFKVENISISTILLSLSIVVSTTLGIVFFGESVSVYKFLGIALILLTVIGVNYKNSQFENNHIYGLYAGILFGVVFSLDKKLVLDTHPITYMFWAFLIIAFFGFIVKPGKTVKSI